MSTTTPANPVFSLAGGTYTGAQTLTITDTTPGAVIYYTIDGPAPTTASAVYTQPLSVSASETVQAVAVAPGLFASSVVSATIRSVDTIDFSQGFALAQGPIQFNGSTDLDDFRLQLTNGGHKRGRQRLLCDSGQYPAVHHHIYLPALQPDRRRHHFHHPEQRPDRPRRRRWGLGYAGIPNSVAIKFDLSNNAGEGPNSPAFTPMAPIQPCPRST